MAEASEEMIALAERIADDMMPHRILREWQIAKDAALAAIQATTERAAKLADGWNAKRRDRATETSIAAALRDGDHLKEQSA